jgi:hypothetical protein
MIFAIIAAGLFRYDARSSISKRWLRAVSRSTLAKKMQVENYLRNGDVTTVSAQFRVPGKDRIDALI